VTALAKGEGLLEVSGFDFKATTVLDYFSHVQKIDRGPPLLALRCLPSLKEISLSVEGQAEIETVFIAGFEPGLAATCPPWASSKMKKLRLGFWLDGHSNDASEHPEHAEANNTLVQRSLNSVNKSALSFMAQLGSQTHLRDLELSFNATYHCWHPRFCSWVSALPMVSISSHSSFIWSISL